VSREAPRAHRVRTVRLLASIVVLAACVLAVVAATRPSFEASVAESPLVGHAAPRLESETLTQAPFDLDALHGRWVVLNFFSSWCVPCQEEVPELVAFAWDQSHERGGAALVSVVFDDSDSSARSFDTTNGVSWPVVTDPGGAFATQFGVTAPPTTFIISPSGKVAANLLGPATERQLDQELATLKQAQAT
jgi:cytochrome c biogenesis protein CcmG/thiol:disulfide interchange protein DsbE